MRLIEKGQPLVHAWASESKGAQRALNLFLSKLHERVGVQLPPTAHGDGASSVAVVASDDAQARAWLERQCGREAWLEEKDEAFRVVVTEKHAVVMGTTASALFAGVGNLLRRCAWQPQSVTCAEGSHTEKAALPMRAVYCPAHFGNFYQLTAPAEMRDYCAELALWGINGVGNWFDPADAVDPFSQETRYRWAREMPLQEWARQARWMRAAGELGLETILCITPNAVYIDQLHPEWLATADQPHIIGPLLCPSKPEAHKIILRNQENLLRFLSERGVRLTALFTAPRDWGGCNCAQCRPWMKTLLRLWDDIMPIALRYHPNAKFHLCTWWAEEAELAIIDEWLRRQRPEWFDSINFSLGYGEMLPQRAVPAGYRKSAFVHIGYGHTRRGVYGTLGGVVAPQRLSRILSGFPQAGLCGFIAYSEGICDDLNKCIIGRLGWQPQSDAKELVSEYCRWYFGSEAAALANAISGLEPIEAASNERLAEIRNALELQVNRLPRYASQWRFDQLLIRARVAAFDRELGDAAAWTARVEKLKQEHPNQQEFEAALNKWLSSQEALIERRRHELERLERQIYRVGAQCHGLTVDIECAAWQAWRAKQK